MSAISKADSVLLILRQRLEERAKAEKRRPGGSAAAAAQRNPLSAVRSMAAVGDTDERQLRRAVVQGLLADQFGDGVLNEAKFQLVVDQVTATIDADEGAAQLLSLVIADLSGSRRAG